MASSSSIQLNPAVPTFVPTWATSQTSPPKRIKVTTVQELFEALVELDFLRLDGWGTDKCTRFPMPPLQTNEYEMICEALRVNVLEGNDKTLFELIEQLPDMLNEARPDLVTPHTRVIGSWVIYFLCTQTPYLERLFKCLGIKSTIKFTLPKPDDLDVRSWLSRGSPANYHEEYLDLTVRKADFYPIRDKVINSVDPKKATAIYYTGFKKLKVIGRDGNLFMLMRFKNAPQHDWVVAGGVARPSVFTSDDLYIPLFEGKTPSPSAHHHRPLEAFLHALLGITAAHHPETIDATGWLREMSNLTKKGGTPIDPELRAELQQRLIGCPYETLKNDVKEWIDGRHNLTSGDSACAAALNVCLQLPEDHAQRMAQYLFAQYAPAHPPFALIKRLICEEHVHIEEVRALLNTVAYLAMQRGEPTVKEVFGGRTHLVLGGFSIEVVPSNDALPEHPDFVELLPYVLSLDLVSTSTEAERQAQGLSHSLNPLHQAFGFLLAPSLTGMAERLYFPLVEAFGEWLIPYFEPIFGEDLPTDPTGFAQILMSRKSPHFPVFIAQYKVEILPDMTGQELKKVEKAWRKEGLLTPEHQLDLAARVSLVDPARALNLLKDVIGEVDPEAFSIRFRPLLHFNHPTLFEIFNRLGNVDPLPYYPFLLDDALALCTVENRDWVQHTKFFDGLEAEARLPFQERLEGLLSELVHEGYFDDPFLLLKRYTNDIAIPAVVTEAAQFGAKVHEKIAGATEVTQEVYAYRTLARYCVQFISISAEYLEGQTLEEPFWNALCYLYLEGVEKPTLLELFARMNIPSGHLQQVIATLSAQGATIITTVGWEGLTKPVNWQEYACGKQCTMDVLDLLERFSNELNHIPPDVWKYLGHLHIFMDARRVHEMFKRMCTRNPNCDHDGTKFTYYLAALDKLRTRNSHLLEEYVEDIAGHFHIVNAEPIAERQLLAHKYWLQAAAHLKLPAERLDDVQKVYTAGYRCLDEAEGCRGFNESVLDFSYIELLLEHKRYHTAKLFINKSLLKTWGPDYWLRSAPVINHLLELRNERMHTCIIGLFTKVNKLFVKQVDYLAAARYFIDCEDWVQSAFLITTSDYFGLWPVNQEAWNALYTTRRALLLEGAFDRAQKLGDVITRHFDAYTELSPSLNTMQYNELVLRQTAGSEEGIAPDAAEEYVAVFARVVENIENLPSAQLLPMARALTGGISAIGQPIAGELYAVINAKAEATINELRAFITIGAFRTELFNTQQSACSTLAFLYTFLDADLWQSYVGTIVEAAEVMAQHNPGYYVMALKSLQNACNDLLVHSRAGVLKQIMRSQLLNLNAVGNYKPTLQESINETLALIRQCDSSAPPPSD